MFTTAFTLAEYKPELTRQGCEDSQGLKATHASGWHGGATKSSSHERDVDEATLASNLQRPLRKDMIARYPLVSPPQAIGRKRLAVRAIYQHRPLNKFRTSGAKLMRPTGYA